MFHVKHLADEAVRCRAQKTCKAPWVERSEAGQIGAEKNGAERGEAEKNGAEQNRVERSGTGIDRH